MRTASSSYVSENQLRCTPSNYAGVCLQNIYDYSPFGVSLDGRTMESDFYRRGFQGQEIDDEVKGEGNSVNYKYRMHDPRIGRFFAIDPLTKDYPELTPYQFSSNRVIDYVEIEGLEGGPSTREYLWSIANPIDAQYVRTNKNIAFKWANWTGLPNATDGKQDAYRHSFWNALNTVDIGRTDAKIIGDLHEASHDPNEDPVAVEMDLFNNQVGIQIAVNYLFEIGGEDNLPEMEVWVKELSTRVKTTLEKGVMKIISMDSDGNYLDKDGYRIDTTKDSWESLKTTVPSNTKPPSAADTKMREVTTKDTDYEYKQTRYNNDGVY